MRFLRWSFGPMRVVRLEPIRMIGRHVRHLDEMRNSSAVPRLTRQTRPVRPDKQSHRLKALCQFSNNKIYPCPALKSSWIHNKAYSDMTDITTVWTTNNMPLWLIGTAEQQTARLPPGVGKKNETHFRPLPVFEHVHHPGGERVDLVGVVPEDKASHPLLILTVTAKNRKLHTSNYARRRQCENIVSKWQWYANLKFKAVVDGPCSFLHIFPTFMHHCIYTGL
jgi:hypothetical protein